MSLDTFLSLNDSHKAESLGVQIRNQRLVRGTTQVDLAKATGISSKTLSRYENSSATPSFTSLQKISNTLGIPLEIRISPDETPLDTDSNETVASVFGTLTETQKTIVHVLVGMAICSNGNCPNNRDKKIIADILNTLTEKQKTVVYALLGEELENAADEV